MLLIILITAFLRSFDPAFATIELGEPGIGTKPSPYAQIVRKTPTATEKITGQSVPYCLWYDKDTWSQLKKNLNPAAEYSFSLNGEDTFAMILPEKDIVPLEKIPTIVIEAAKLNGVKNPQILQEEMRLVNGVQVLSLKWSGEILGMNFVYLYIIHSSDKGTVQAITYTLEDSFEDNKDDMEEFLKCFCMIENERLGKN